jgi:uncharacterized tellurite resistance protein B-like protein
MAKNARKELIMTLAKTLIAAAWSDGEISLDERNCLKELLFNLRDLTAHDWASLEIYMAAPLEEKERKNILDALRSTIRSPADKRMASEALKQMIESSGQTSTEQDRVITEIMHALQDISVDPVSHLSKALRVPLRQRSSELQYASARELELEEFMRNRIAFHLRRQIHNHPLQNISDDEIHVWSAAGGLLARVAHVDREVKEEERAAMVNAMGKHWKLPDQVIAALIDIALDEISKGLDFYRLTRQFYQKTKHEERQQFVTSLFEIALADGEISHDETEEIRHIARGLKLTHRQMIKAKLDATGD